MKDSNQAEDEIVIAVVWYRPEQWQRVRDIAAPKLPSKVEYLSKSP